MSDFFTNTAIAIWAFGAWYLCGLGPTLLLLPNHRRVETFFLAPLLGMCLLTLIGLFQITVLLIPLFPRLNTVILLIISLLLCFYLHKDLLVAWKKFHKLLGLGLPIFVLIIVFSWMFHNGGFQTLVAGADQLQYANDARQIREEMHTGSKNDIPIPRQDHYVYEVSTRNIPYLKRVRRGADTMLATMSAFTGISYEEAFPVTVLCSLMTLGFALGFLGRQFLHLTLRDTLVLQFSFLSSFYLLYAHIGGSLALLMSLAPGLVALALMLRVKHLSSWGAVILTAIIIATYLSIYSEPALVNIVMPSFLLVIWEWRRSQSKFFATLFRISIMYLLVFACTPFAFNSVATNSIANFSAIYSQFKAMGAEFFIPHPESSFLHFWLVPAAMLGGFSYYDLSSFNIQVSQIIANVPWISRFAFLTLCFFGLLGCFKVKNQLARLYAIVMLFWILSTIILAQNQDTLRFARSVQYTIPFVIIGLVLLASGHHPRSAGKVNVFLNAVSWIGRVILLSFVTMNVCTSARTINYITSTHINNGQALIKFDERAPQWKLVKNELKNSATRNAPILFSGFSDAIQPFIIAIVIRSQPQVVGSSISKFWPIYIDNTLEILSNFYVLPTVPKLEGKYLKTYVYIPRKPLCKSELIYVSEFGKYIPVPINDMEKFNRSLIDIVGNRTSKYLSKDQAQQLITANGGFTAPLRKGSFLWKQYNTRLSEDDLNTMQEIEGEPWQTVIPSLIKRSEQAVVPTGHGFPEEWQSSQDVYAHRRKHFANLCDVIYRNDYSAALLSSMTSSLKNDTQGLYRLLLKSGPVIIHGKHKKTHLFSLNYQGEIGDVSLQIRKLIIQGKVEGMGKLIRIEKRIPPEDTDKLKLVVAKTVKLRSLEWSES